MPNAKTTPPAAAPALPDLPADLDGWRWHVDTMYAITPRYSLQEPASDWTTKQYYDAGKAIAEARRRVLSRPKAKPIAQEPTVQAIDAAIRENDPAALAQIAGAAAPALMTAIRPEHIRIDGGTQARAGLDPATVAEYVEAMRDLCYQRNGLDRIPPIVVFHDGSTYWLADGFHRLAAYKELQQQANPAPPSALRAEVRQGHRRDAVLYAAGANADHGLRRTTADKERAVLALLQDEEWGRWSGREIARRCRVSHDFVRNVEERHNLTGRASSARKTADGRTMDTSGIAAANTARAEPAGDNPAPGDPRIEPMRERCKALGYTQFYPSDKGYTAAHPKTGVANYGTWAAVEADIARKEAMTQPRVCFVCGQPWGAPGSMLVGGERHCPSCASAAMTAQNERAATARQESVLAVPDAVRSSIAALEARGWGVDPDGADYTLFKDLDAYRTDADGVIALAQLAGRVEVGRIADLGGAIEDAPPTDQPPDFPIVAARFAALGWRLEATGGDRYAMYPPDALGIGNATWYGVTSRLEAVEQRGSAIPADIAQMAHALALTIERRDDGRLLLFWPDESADDLISQSPDQARDWLTNEAPQIAIERAALLGWTAGTHKRAGQTLHTYLRKADGRETAEYADQALAAGEALRIAAKDPARDPAAVCMCGNRSTGRRNIGGTLAERCQRCAVEAEQDDLRAQLGAQYHTCIVNDDGAWHYIVWDGGAAGNYTYDAALSMFHSSAMTLRRFATGTPTPREAAAAWLGQMSATLRQAPESTMFRWSEMQQAAAVVAALLAATPAPYDPGPMEAGVHGPISTLAELDDLLAPIARAVADVEVLIAAGQVLPAQARSLADCRKRLDALAGDETIDTERYEALSTRIGDAQRRLAELSEAGVEVGA